MYLCSYICIYLLRYVSIYRDVYIYLCMLRRTACVHGVYEYCVHVSLSICLCICMCEYIYVNVYVYVHVILCFKLLYECHQYCTMGR